MDAEEISDAKEEFLGKLTREALSEKLGHVEWGSVTDLDLRMMRIKDVTCFYVLGESLQNVTVLRLDNNSLLCADFIVPLKRLRILSLGNNKIERLFSAECQGEIKFKDMEELHINNNQIQLLSDLSLSAFPKLRILHANANKIQKAHLLFTYTR